VHDSSTHKSPKSGDPKAVGGCMLLSMLVMTFEGIATFSVKDDRPKISGIPPCWATCWPGSGAWVERGIDSVVT
jgi:hypothetical protein